MKKMMKICAVTAVALIALGMVLAQTAKAARGSARISQVVAQATDGRLDLQLGNGQNGIWGIYWNGPADWDGAESHETDVTHETDSQQHGELHHGESAGQAPAGSESFDPEQVRDLAVQAGGCIFEMETSPDGLFYVTAEGVRKFRCYLEEGTLHIEAEDARVGIGIDTSAIGTVTLYAPEGHSYGEVEMEAGAGTVYVNGLKAGEVSLEAGAGVIEAKDIQAREMELSVGAGQISLYGMDVESLDAETGLGELTARGRIGADASLACSMGNIELELEGSQQDFNYRLEAAAGEIELGTEHCSGLASERWIDNGAGKTLEAECAMGSIQILFQ